MAKISPNLRHLDSLVSDYLKRRDLLPDKETAVEEYMSDSGDFTLENVYFSRFGKDTKTAILLEKVISAENREPNIQGPLSPPPVFPTEVIAYILESCSVKQLLALQLLSKSLSELCCKSLLTISCKPNRFTSLNAMTRFHNIIETRIEGCGIPFGAYYFTAWNLYNIRIVDTMGCDIKVAHFVSNEFLFETMPKLPNLQKLMLKETPNLPDFTAPHMTSSEDKNLEYLEKWLALAPGLQEIKSKISLQIDSASDLINLFHSHKSLHKVSVLEVSASFENGAMSVNLLPHYEATGLYASRMRIFSNYIKQLSTPYGQYLPLTNLPGVTSIELQLEGIHSDNILICPGQFPALKHVTLYSPQDSSFVKNHANIVFSEVESLTITTHDWTSVANQLNSNSIYHRIFPRITKLGLGGRIISKNDIEYFAENFAKLKSLHFIDLNVIKYWNLGEHKSKKEWPFSRLKYLKKVEFSKTYYLNTLVEDLVTLTLSKSLQPLEGLIIRWRKTENTERISEDKLRLFYAMNQLNYHKNLKFRVIEPTDKF